MKNLIFTLLCAAMFNSTFATDLAVSEGGGGGSYSTITAALNAAAASGDRIIITPKPGGAAYTESLTITKSIQLLSGTEGVQWRILGNITYNPSATGSQLTIVGMHNLSGNITTGIAAPGATRSNVRILGCTLNSGYIDFNQNNYELTCESDSLKVGYISFSYGKVVGNYINSTGLSVSSITIGNNDLSPSNNTIYVVGNKIVACAAYYNYYGINCLTTNFYVHITNNFIQTNIAYQYGLYMSASKTGTLPNYVQNNTVTASVTNYYWAFYFTGLSSPAVIESNLFGSNLTLGIFSNNALTTSISFNHFYTGMTTIIGGAAINDGTNTQSTFSVNATNGAATSGSPINGGNPDFGHYDLDLTANDAGTGGGSYTMTQFHPIVYTPGSRTAFVIAPRRVVVGQTISIQAEGFDK